MVVALLGIFAGMALPLFEANTASQLITAAQIVAADLDYARQLAVSNNSTYTLTWQSAYEQYYLAHSGFSTELNTLPTSAFRLSSDPSNRQTTAFTAVPQLAGVRLHDVYQLGTTARTAVTSTAFGPLGNTVAANTTEVWLTANSANQTLYVSITVNPVTGLAEIGDIAGAAPELTFSIQAPQKLGAS